MVRSQSKCLKSMSESLDLQPNPFREVVRWEGEMCHWPDLVDTSTVQLVKVIQRGCACELAHTVLTCMCWILFIAHVSFHHSPAQYQDPLHSAQCHCGHRGGCDSGVLCRWLPRAHSHMDAVSRTAPHTHTHLPLVQFKISLVSTYWFTQH